MTGASATSLLRLVHVNKSFGALRVSQDISLDISPGECHAIIGPNGAGKTTLIHQISGALSPDSGSIWFDGHDVTRASMPARVRTGLVRSFQITSILPIFSVLENVALAVQSRSGSSFRFWQPVANEAQLNAQARAALAIVGLDERAQILAGLLSHGEKRQLELALALALEPKLLMLDEPMAGVGAEETSALVKTLLALKSRMTIILVEHDMHAVFALADRISVLVAGRLIATGTPDAVRAHAEVRAAYLGEPEALPISAG